MTNLPMLRTSERASFKRCPQRWWWSYRRGLRPLGAPSNPLWFGTGVHLALEHWYIAGPKRGVDPRETWDKYCKDEIRSIRVDDPNGESLKQQYVDSRVLGIDMLAGYLELYGNDDNWDVLSPEKVFAVLIPNPKDPKQAIVDYRGKWDGVYRDLEDGYFKLMEHKTAAAIDTGHLPLDDQAGSYWAVASHQLRQEGLLGPKERIRGITYNFLKKALQDVRPRNATGQATNKPTKVHYNAAGYEGKLADMVLEAEAEGVVVCGDPSANQPPVRYLREFVERTSAERNTQIRRIGVEATAMNLFRDGTLDLYKTPTRDCKWDCDFFTLCQVDEQGGDTKDFIAQTMHRQDPYADHRGA